MKQLQRIDQHGTECPECCICRCRILFLRKKSWFNDLNIPVTELGPDKVVDLLNRNTEFVFLHVLGNFLRQSIYLGKDPLICLLEFLISRLCDRIITQMHHNETGCIPYLIGKVTAGFYTFVVETHIVTRRITCNKGETKCVCTVFINNLQRVNTIAEGLTHLTSL